MRGGRFSARDRTRRHIAASNWRGYSRRTSRSRGYLLLPVVLVIAVVAAVAFLMNRESAVDIRTAGAIAEADAARYVAEAGLSHALWSAGTGACSGYGIATTTFSGHSYKVEFTPDSGSPVTITSTGTLASGASRSLRRDGVRIGATPLILLLQPDATAGADTYIHDGTPTTSFGTDAEIRISNKTNSQKRGLIRFDLSGINSTAIVESAQLELNLQGIGSGGTATIHLHRALKPWVEDEATWNQYANGFNWDTAGGDYEIPEITSSAIDAAFPGATSFDVTDLAQEWISEPAKNNGVMLLGSAGVNHADFTTSDSPSATLRPKLIVTYACECGVVCVPPPPTCDADFTADTKVSEFFTAGQPYEYNRGITYFPEGNSINGVAAPAGGGWIAVGNSGRLVLLDMSGTIVDDGFDTGLGSLEGVAFIPSGANAGKLAIVSGNNLYFSDPTVLPPSSSYTSHVLAVVNDAGGITHIQGGTYDNHLAIADSGSEQIHILDQSLNLVITLAASTILDSPNGVAHLKDTDKFLVVDKIQNAALILDTALSVSQNYSLAPFGWGDPQSAEIHPNSCNHVVGDQSNERYASLNATGGPGVLDVRVAASSDDAEEFNFNNNVDLNSGDLELVEDLGFSQTVGMRFANITVPGGATITNAWIQFKADETDTGPVNLTIQGEAADDAATFVDANGNISSRPLTTAAVSWSPPNWQTVGEAGPKQQTSDISAVIQEIVNRPGWASGNALAIIITSTSSKKRTAESYDGDPAGAPLLHIEF